MIGPSSCFVPFIMSERFCLSLRLAETTRKENLSVFIATLSFFSCPSVRILDSLCPLIEETLKSVNEAIRIASGRDKKRRKLPNEENEECEALAVTDGRHVSFMADQLLLVW